MNRMVSRLCACLVAFSLFAALCGGMVARAADGFDYNYTYTYDYWGDERQSPDAYRTSAMLSSVSLGLETPMRTPRGLTVSGNDIYIVDTGNNRILQVARDGESFTLTRVISEISGDITPNTLSAPQDVFVMADGTLFIADTNNNRILKADRNLNLLSVFTRPTDATFDQSMAFLPTKLVCDTTGRVFCLAQNVNRGLMKYEADGTFTGFIGASEGKYTWYELVWRLLSTKEQRAQQASFVPTEYNNIALDSEGFFFVTTQTFNSNELISGAAKPVRRLNAIGTNILIENGTSHVIGDLQWARGDTNITNSGPSKFVDVTVLDNDIYSVMDKTHNRIFTYDKQGNLLWAFGGVGNMDGYFLNPVALEHQGYDLLVLDSQDCCVTVLTPTEYGKLVYKATEQYHAGEYAASADTWREVMKRNGNYDLAYIGIGRALLQQKQFKEACDYFAMARDSRNYSEAFRYYRSEWVEQNIGWIFGIVAVLLVVPMVVGHIRKIKWEVDNA